MQPPAPLIQRALTTQEITDLNRQYSPPNGTNDVRNVYIQSNAAPWGVPIVDRDCPYAAQGALGEYLLLEFCAIYNSYGQVVDWKTFYDLERNPYQVRPPLAALLGCVFVRSTNTQNRSSGKPPLPMMPFPTAARITQSASAISKSASFWTKFSPTAPMAAPVSR